MDCSVFDIFKAGPGPSSSHTIGPMKAALAFRRKLESLPRRTLERAASIHVSLYGSLADTGQGHGSDRAVIAGLLGMAPETCASDALSKIDPAKGASICIPLTARSFDFPPHSLAFVKGPHHFKFQNTMRFELRDADAKRIAGLEAYSVGGGFVKYKGEAKAERTQVPWPFKSMRELKELLGKTRLSLPRLMMDNEIALSGIGRAELERRLDFILDLMRNSVELGLAASGTLPGTLGLHRKARTIYRNATKLKNPYGKFMALLDSYAMAAAEENAAGHKIVTAPTSGSSGVMPAVARALSIHARIPKRRIRDGLLAAAAIGGISRMNASISGAEVGCQGEIGVAAAMAAAMIAQAKGASLKVMENAAEIALEHHLGLTCDPVGGYVQIPCIERNAIAAVHAWNAFMIASNGDPKMHKVGFDEVLEAMRQTGRDMSLKYKETSRGGLAVCAGGC